MYCKRCGFNIINTKAAFCPKCGTKVVLEKSVEVKLEENQYYTGSPIVLLGGSISNFLNKNILSIRLQNISAKNIIAIIFDIYQWDVSKGEIAKIEDYRIQDINVAVGENIEFTEIPLHMDTRWVKVFLKKVVYRDGNVYQNEEREFVT